MAVHVIEALGFRAREVAQAQGHDLEPGLLDEGEDVSGMARLHGVRLDDGKGSLCQFLSFLCL
jgi:hypothetical protein